MQKVRQAFIIIFTIVAVLSTAYVFRTPRNVETKLPNCEGNNCLKRVDLETVQTPDVEEKPVEFESNESLTIEELRRKFLETPYILDKFTIVTPSFKRTDNLYRIFKNYCPMKDIVHKIIILWNNIGEPLPPKLKANAGNCSIPVVIKIMQKNNLTSRFIPYPEIETTAILSIDDDLLLPSQSLHLAFKTWRQYPYLLIGYTPRTFTETKGHYTYRIYSAKSYTMIMTNVAFIHHMYLELFTTTVPKKIKDYIVETTNGEDITMNVVVGKYLTEMGHPQSVGIAMTSNKKEIGNLSKSGYKGLWHRTGHKNQRSECLNLLAKVYGQLYLHESSKTVSKERDIDHQ